MSEQGRQAYVAGVIDAWENVTSVTKELKKKNPSYTSGVVEEMFSPVMTCVHDRMTYVQATAIVDKYMSQNPEVWHVAMASNVWTAMAATCKQRP